MDLSIIIPVYNAEKYITSCLYSLENQEWSGHTYEIIVVNDGSTDTSPKIIAQLAQKIPEIKLINQDNQGNGAARNTGLANAHGKYIYFLDADDYIAYNTMGTVLQMAKEHQLDVLGFDSKRTISSEETHYNGTPIEKLPIKVQSGVDFVADHDYRAEIWWYLVKKSCLNSCVQLFHARKFVQDAYFTPRAFLQAERMAKIDASIHRYRWAQESITQKKTSKHFQKHLDDLFFALNELQAIADNHQQHSVKKRMQAKRNNYAFIILGRTFRSEQSYTTIKKVIQRLREHGCYPISYFRGKYYSSYVYIILITIFNHGFLLRTAHGVKRFFNL